MSLSGVTIYNNKLSKRNIDFQQNSTIQGRFFKYLGGDNLVYKNYTIEDQNGENYSQIYNVSGTTTTDNNFNVNALYLQYGYNLLPKFAVIMFSGGPLQIPEGWLLCDGSTQIINGVSVTSPNLSGRFVLSYGQGPLDFVNTTVGATGGEQKHTLTISEIPAHKHSVISANDDFNNSSAPYPNYSKGSFAQYDSGSITWTDSMTRTGGIGSAADGSTNVNNATSAHNTMPPYYVLCYIMKGF